jgi:WhiB family redox-sensing transcriptional regulator
VIARCHAPDTDSLWALLNLGSLAETAWMVEALCAQTDPESFFPGKGEPTGPARLVCLACPVRSECLAYAVRRNERDGIWGGTSPRERRVLRRELVGLWRGAA